MGRRMQHIGSMTVLRKYNRAVGELFLTERGTAGGVGQISLEWQSGKGTMQSCKQSTILLQQALFITNS